MSEIQRYIAKTQELPKPHKTYIADEIVVRNDAHESALRQRDERIAELEDANKELDRELRQERGLKALLANGMPPTGNEDFDKILATHPIAAMIQRGWLPGISGFDDLPALESAICHFWGVSTIAEAVNPKFNLEREGASA